MIKYRHIPTGWIYVTDPECPIYLILENDMRLPKSMTRIPASLARFPGQKDWIEYETEPMAVNKKGELC
jgi:hypothetical protein